MKNNKPTFLSILGISSAPNEIACEQITTELKKLSSAIDDAVSSTKHASQSVECTATHTNEDGDFECGAVMETDVVSLTDSIDDVEYCEGSISDSLDAIDHITDLQLYIDELLCYIEENMTDEENKQLAADVLQWNLTKCK